MMYRIYGDINSPCFTGGLFKILLKHRGVLLTSFKRKFCNIKFSMDAASEEEFKNLLDELSNLETFRIIKIKETI